MARLYDWEAFLTKIETDRIRSLRNMIEDQKRYTAMAQAEYDSVRRKAVQRARNALNKQLRAEHREKVK